MTYNYRSMLGASGDKIEQVARVSNSMLGPQERMMRLPDKDVGLPSSLGIFKNQTSKQKTNTTSVAQRQTYQKITPIMQKMHQNQNKKAGTSIKNQREIDLMRHERQQQSEKMVFDNE